MRRQETEEEGRKRTTTVGNTVAGRSNPSQQSYMVEKIRPKSSWTKFCENSKGGVPQVGVGLRRRKSENGKDRRRKDLVLW